MTSAKTIYSHFWSSGGGTQNPIAQNIPTPQAHVSRTYPQLHNSTLIPPSTTTSSTAIWHSGLAPHHYELVVLPPNVRKCYGCAHEFVDKHRQHPYNITMLVKSTL